MHHTKRLKEGAGDLGVSLENSQSERVDFVWSAGSLNCYCMSDGVVCTRLASASIFPTIQPIHCNSCVMVGWLAIAYEHCRCIDFPRH